MTAKLVGSVLHDNNAQKQAHQCKARLKVYDGRKITPKGKASLACECKGKFTVLVFILGEQGLQPILGQKTCLQLELVMRIYSFKEESLESKYADVFESLVLVEPDTITPFTLQKNTARQG